MSGNIRTRLRKRRQPGHNQEDKKDALKKLKREKSSKTTGSASDGSSNQNITDISSSNSKTSSSLEMCDSGKADVLINNTDSEDTKEYESDNSHREEISEQNLNESTSGDETNGMNKTDFAGMFERNNTNCELLSKLLNDINDQSCHAREGKSESTNRSNLQLDYIESEQVYFDGSRATKQLATSNDGTTDVSKSCEPADASLHDRTMENNNSTYTSTVLETISADETENMKQLCHDNWAITPTDKQDNSSRIKAVKKENPHLTELITKDEKHPEPFVGKKSAAASRFHNKTRPKQGHDITGEETSNMPEINIIAEKSVSKQKFSTKQDDNYNDVDVEEKAVVRDSKDTKKTSIRLRRRSGDAWAVRYEKDFVLTPLAKLSKDHATFLPPKGTDATVVSEENLCRQLRQRCDDGSAADVQFGDEDFPSTSSQACKKGVQYKRRKYRKKSKHTANRKYALKKKFLCTTPLEQPGISSQ